MSKNYKKAVAAINSHHIQLVYPIKNAQEPASLWRSLHPRSFMKWDWSEDADQRVVDIWHLKDELCFGQDVVYAKWFRGRATFFSKEIFVPVLRLLETTQVDEIYRNTHANDIYEELLDRSPQTPKLVGQAVDLSGSQSRSDYEKGVKLLWEQLLIVGTGEVDEGQFPALAMGATKHIFEDLWDEARSMDPLDASERCRTLLPADSSFYKFLNRMMIKFAGRGLQSD